MAGGIGVPTGGIEYRHKLNIALKDCRNCVHHKRRINHNTGKRYTWCTGFGMRITDMKNAKCCTAFCNKHPEEQIRKAVTQSAKQKHRQRSGG